MKGYTRLPVDSSSTLENVYNISDLSGSKRLTAIHSGTSRFLKETHLTGRTSTEATKSLSWAGTGCSRFVAISCLRHLGYRAAGRSRVIHHPNLADIFEWSLKPLYYRRVIYLMHAPARLFCVAIVSGPSDSPPWLVRILALKLIFKTFL